MSIFGAICVYVCIALHVDLFDVIPPDMPGLSLTIELFVQADLSKVFLHNIYSFQGSITVVKTAVLSICQTVFFLVGFVAGFTT